MSDYLTPIILFPCLTIIMMAVWLICSTLRKRGHGDQLDATAQKFERFKSKTAIGISHFLRKKN